MSARAFKKLYLKDDQLSKEDDNEDNDEDSPDVQRVANAFDLVT